MPQVVEAFEFGDESVGVFGRPGQLLSKASPVIRTRGKRGGCRRGWVIGGPVVPK